MQKRLLFLISAFALTRCCTKVDCELADTMLSSTIRLEGFPYSGNDSVQVVAQTQNDSVARYEGTVPVRREDYTGDTSFRLPYYQYFSKAEFYTFTHLPTDKTYRVDEYGIGEVAYSCNQCFLTRDRKTSPTVDWYHVNGRKVNKPAYDNGRSNFYIRFDW